MIACVTDARKINGSSSGSAREFKLRLAPRTPAASPTPQLCTTQSLPASRALSAIPPAMLKEPGARRIVPSLSNNRQRLTADLLQDTMQAALLCRGDGVRGPRGRPLKLPENFIRHPIADAGKVFLVQQQSFQRQLGMARQRGLHLRELEILAAGRRWEIAPPRWGLPTLMNTQAAKHPRIAKDQRLRFLKQHQVIVLLRQMICGQAE